MKIKTILLAFALTALVSSNAEALSRRIGRDIEFPRNYDPAKAEAIRKVVQDQGFQFVDGTVSYWPPDWSTRLSFEGDAASLNEFFERLRGLPGIGLRVVLFRGQDNERRRDSSWQLDFSHARPDELTVYLNVNSTKLDLSKIVLPGWPAVK